MNITEETIMKEPERVQSMFRYWEKYMEEQVQFWDIPGGPEIHAGSHCERVLLHALRIGEWQGLKLRAMIALAHASIFHDTRRKDNYLDVGHGDRAAEYYQEHCEKAKLHFLPEAYATIKFHDRDDALGEDYIIREAKSEVEDLLNVFHIFKDADALDRLRLGTWCLDVNFLRTDAAKGMVDYAQQLVEQTTDPVALKRTYDMLSPFNPALKKKAKDD